MNNNKKPSSLNETKRNNNVISKLRRLKIEENFLLQSLKKLDQKRNYEVSESDVTNDVDCKNTIKNLKDSYTNIKNLLDDLKIVTSSQELLAELEIYEIKNKALELETTIKSCKFYIHTEVRFLKSAEQDLTKQLEEINFKDTNIMKRANIPLTSLKQAVPSPVRLLMTSPLKCTEVQEFQDFMKNSPNRYGGWNEYHHNIFVKIWKKYFGNDSKTECSDSLVENLALDNFFEESIFKLQGIDKKSLMSHIDWYKQYLFLKSKQQTAIDKWKSNRRSIRKVPDDNRVQNEVGNSRQLKYAEIKKTHKASKPMNKITRKEDIERVAAPTKQWLSRCEYEQKREQIPFIENLEKLRIPHWRHNL